MKRVRQYSTFFVEQLHFGVPVELVQEAILPVPTTAVPLTTDVVVGLINLRGQIVMALEMRARIGLPPRGAANPSVSLILRTTDGLVSLQVDRLGDVLDLEAVTVRGVEPPISEDPVPEDEGPERGEHEDDEAEALAARDAASQLWEALPDTVHGPLRELVHGIVKLDRSLLLVLDPELLAKPDVCLTQEIDNLRGKAAIGQLRSPANQTTTK
jgi:purine-binding chemotaxis protein CheW